MSDDSEAVIATEKKTFLLYLSNVKVDFTQNLISKKQLQKIIFRKLTRKLDLKLINKLIQE